MSPNIIIIILRTIQLLSHKYRKHQSPFEEKFCFFWANFPSRSVIIPLKLFDRADPNHLAIIR